MPERLPVLSVGRAEVNHRNKMQKAKWKNQNCRIAFGDVVLNGPQSNSETLHFEL
jgi:hypothetical protein